jgi:hypothetical protein
MIANNNVSASASRKDHFGQLLIDALITTIVPWLQTTVRCNKKAADKWLQPFYI